MLSNVSIGSFKVVTALFLNACSPKPSILPHASLPGKEGSTAQLVVIKKGSSEERRLSMQRVLAASGSREGGGATFRATGFGARDCEFVWIGSCPNLLALASPHSLLDASHALHYALQESCQNHRKRIQEKAAAARMSRTSKPRRERSLSPLQALASLKLAAGSVVSLIGRKCFHVVY